MNRGNRSGTSIDSRARTRFFASDIGRAGPEAEYLDDDDDMATHEKEERDDNQHDNELFLADDGSTYFSELATETSSLASGDSSGWSENHSTITAVRVRPMLPTERRSGHRVIVDMTVSSDGLITRIVNPTALPPKSAPDEGTSARFKTTKMTPNQATAATHFPAQFTQEFRFDCNFWSVDRSSERQLAAQDALYDDLGVLSLQTVWQGYNCSVFAYGQSNSGKTYSMMGSSGERASLPAKGGNASSGTKISGALLSSQSRGLIPRICQALFAEIDESNTEENMCAVHMSYLEIYDERIYDLLTRGAVKKSLKIREHPEDGVYADQAQCVHVTSSAEVLTFIEDGNQRRLNGSRSHTVLTFSLTRSQTHSFDLTPDASQNIEIPQKSKLCLVNLAGTERVDHSNSNGLRRREAANINRSLAALADVVGALSKRRSSRTMDPPHQQKMFVPYRNSVLTRLLKDSLGGSAKTIMLGTISPCCVHYEESLSTLKYIERAKNVFSAGRLQVDTSDDIPKFRAEVDETKLALSAMKLSSEPANDADMFAHSPLDEKTSDIMLPDRALHDTIDDPVEFDPTEAALVGIGSEADHVVAGDFKCDRPEIDLRKSIHLMNLLAIRRRWQALRQYRALDKWKTYTRKQSSTAQTLGVRIRKSSTGIVSPQKQNTSVDTGPNKGRNKKVVSAVVVADAICCSVVQAFMFPDRTEPSSLSSTKPNSAESSSLLELLASSSEYDRSDLHSDNCVDETTQSFEVESPEALCSPTEQQTACFETDKTLSRASIPPASSPAANTSGEETLALCVDSIDIARRAIGPGMYKLSRFDEHGVEVENGTGVERELLWYLDKKLSAMSQCLEELIITLQGDSNINLPRVSCESLEAMLGEFCLQIIARVCDQLPSASSGCVGGRLQLEAQLKQFSDRLTQQFLPVLGRQGRNGGQQHLIGNSTVWSVGIELLGMSERIKVVWFHTDQSKRQQMLHKQALKFASANSRKLAHRIFALEALNAELTEKYDSCALSNKEESSAQNADGCTTDDKDRKLVAEVDRSQVVQARNDKLLNGLSTSNRELAAAKARVNMLEARLLDGMCSTSAFPSGSQNANVLDDTLATLSNRVVTLEKELEDSQKCVGEMRLELLQTENTNLNQTSTLDNFKALLSCEQAVRKKLDADLALMQSQSSAQLDEARCKLAESQERIKELANTAEVVEREAVGTKQELASVLAKNDELSTSLRRVGNELSDALTQTNGFESECLQLREANADLEICCQDTNEKQESTTMLSEELTSRHLHFMELNSGQAQQISALEVRLSEDDRQLRELKLKLTSAQEETNHLATLLSQTEEALVAARSRESELHNRLDEAILEANSLREELTQRETAFDAMEAREKVLQKQLEMDSTQKIEEVNCLRGELHQATLEVASLREELTEVLDQSTLQCSEIDTLKTEVQNQTSDWDIEREKLEHECKVSRELLEQKEREHLETKIHLQQLFENADRKREVLHQEHLASQEALQLQREAFHNLQVKYDSLETESSGIIQELESQLEVHSAEIHVLETMFQTEVTNAEDTIKTTKFQLQQSREDRDCLNSKLETCQSDLVGSTRRWVQAETQRVLLRLALDRHLAQGKAVSLDDDNEVQSKHDAISDSNNQEEALCIAQSLSDGNQLGVKEDLKSEAECKKCELAASRDDKPPSKEVAKLRAMIVKLKAALDAKDDMLLFLDGRVAHLENIALKCPM